MAVHAPPRRERAGYVDARDRHRAPPVGAGDREESLSECRYGGAFSDTLNVTRACSADQLAKAKSYGVLHHGVSHRGAAQGHPGNQTRQRPKPVSLAINLTQFDGAALYFTRTWAVHLSRDIVPGPAHYTAPSHQPAGDAGPANVRCLLQLIPIWIKNPVMSLSYRLAGDPAPFRDLYQSRGLLRSGGDGPPYPANGQCYSGTGHHSPGPLRLYQLRQIPWRTVPGTCGRPIPSGIFRFLGVYKYSM